MYKHAAAYVLQRAGVVTFKVLSIIRNPHVCMFVLLLQEPQNESAAFSIT